MAPHALTPTVEESERFEENYGFLQDEHAESHEMLAPRPAHSSGLVDDADTTQPYDISTRADGHFVANDATTCGEDRIDDPSPNVSYEAAYVDGYKEGYKDSHIALQHRPIAIVGMSCRFPGNVSTPDEFWELLARCRSGFSPIPPSRFSANRFFHPNPGKSGTTNARGGNFLTHDMAAFDAPFFGFTQQEAVSLDPQQRLLLECTFEALEGAGMPMHNIVGKDIGVFVGGTFSEYEADSFRDPETIPMHQATGCAMAMQSNRISHFFDLRGPSFTVDTACSSSLVAIHTACQSLRNGESSMAIAAGVHLNMLPEFWISYSMSRLFGEAGKSFAFDQRGTGYGRGEGCGMILLKPLDDALRDNDPIRAVITGSGINQDGKTPGITMPNGSAQEALIRAVYKNGGMNPNDTGYIEAHGTGTHVGDPIEVTALQKVFGEDRSKRKPLYIGSVKSNIGHLEAAAGIAGIIKTALMLERGFILPNYDFKQPNEKIPFDAWGLKVPVRQQPWPIGKRWASVNGFGFGGTNAHVVMTRGPLDRKTMKEEINTQTTERLFVISANDKVSTEKAMQNLGVYLERRPEIFENDLLTNLAYTLGQRKSLHTWRVAMTSSTAADLVEALFSGRFIPARQELEDLRIGWVFTGQGAQWWAMGRELYHQYPVYASTLDKADAHLRFLGAKFSILEELERDESNTQINAAHISQPICTAVQLAMVELLHSWGVQPSAVTGHSSGEIGAAYAAGLITFEDAMAIAYHRGRIIPLLKKEHPGLDGSMLAVGAGRDVISPIIDRIPQSSGEVRIACINSPSSITISGDTEAIMKLQDLIEEVHPGMFARKLQVDTAYHSHHMNLVAKAYTESLRNLERPKPSSILFHSSLFGRLAKSTELDASYWVQNLTCAVRFDEALQSMCLPVGEFKIGVNFLMEIGPHAALQGPIKQIIKHIGSAASKIAYSSMLSRKKDAVQTALALAGTLFVKGAVLNMGAINFPRSLDRSPQVLTDLPRYAWNHATSFYHESRLTKIHKFHDAPRNDIIGVLAPYSNDFEPTWRNIVRLDDLPWLRHHQVQGVTIFPISGFVVMALEAMGQKAQTTQTPYDSLEVRDLTVKAPVILTEDELEMTINLRKAHGGSNGVNSNEFNIRSWSKTQGWVQHCSGFVSVASSALNEVDGLRAQKMEEDALRSKRAKINQAATIPIIVQQLYERLSEMGVSFGTTFRGLQNCHASSSASAAHLLLADTVAEMPFSQETNYILHPTLLERLISMYWPILDAVEPLRTIHLPSSIGKVTVSTRISEHFKNPSGGLRSFCEPSLPLSDVRPNILSMFATDAGGVPLISVKDLLTSPIPNMNSELGSEGARELCYKLEWEAVSDPKLSTTVGTMVPQFSTEVIIIHDENDSQIALASTISDCLTDLTGCQPTTGTLLTVAGLVKDKLCIFLTELSRPMLANLTEVEFVALQQVLTSVHGLLWVVRGAYTHSKNPSTNMITGLSRTLRSEGTLMQFITLDLDSKNSHSYSAISKTILDVFVMTLDSNSTVEETEFAERDGKLLTPRIVNDAELNDYVYHKIHPAATEPARFLDIERPLQGLLATPGVFDSLTFDDDKDFQAPLASEDVTFQVKAVGISLKDTVGDCTSGFECSGVVVAVGCGVSKFKVGDRVAAITPNGSLSTLARTHSRLLFKIPDQISYEEAATIPVAYCSAAYALIDQARCGEGETVLVHDAASAIGQAALTVAQMIGADVWVTVKNTKEKKLLSRDFGVSEDRTWFIDGAAFAKSIQEATRGRGVDIVFCSSTEACHLEATWNCIAAFGRFITVSSDSRVLASHPLGNTVTFLSADVAALAQHRPETLRRTLVDVSRLLRYGKVAPIRNFRTFGITEFATALQDDRQAIGDEIVVIVPRDDESVLAPRIPKKTTLLQHDATYVLIGGTGGLGRSMAKWLFGKGAKHIVLLSRSGALNGQAKEDIDTLNNSGAHIVVRRCDVADRADVDKLVTTGLSGLPPVRGIIHGAMVLNDVLFEKMTFEQYTTVVASKVQGAWNFHHALAAANVSLDFFILISSAAGVVGNRGQAAYAAANTFLNGFAQQLLHQGVHAASIDLTAVSDAGYLAQDAEKAAEVARNLGGDTICEAEVLALIQAAIEGKLVSCNGHPITGMRITPTARPFWSTDAKFTQLLEAAEAASATSATPTISWSALFKAAPSRIEAELIVSDALVEKIAEVIAMEPEALDKKRALSHYPLDSLTAIEVRNFIARLFEANLQVLELLASGSIENLAKVVCAKSKSAVAQT